MVRAEFIGGVRVMVLDKSSGYRPLPGVPSDPEHQVHRHLKFWRMKLKRALKTCSIEGNGATGSSKALDHTLPTVPDGLLASRPRQRGPDTARSSHCKWALRKPPTPYTAGPGTTTPHG